MECLFNVVSLDVLNVMTMKGIECFLPFWSGQHWLLFQWTMMGLSGFRRSSKQSGSVGSLNASKGYLTPWSSPNKNAFHPMRSSTPTMTQLKQMISVCFGAAFWPSNPFCPCLQTHQRHNESVNDLMNCEIRFGYPFTSGFRPANSPSLLVLRRRSWGVSCPDGTLTSLKTLSTQPLTNADQPVPKRSIIGPGLWKWSGHNQQARLKGG